MCWKCIHESCVQQSPLSPHILELWSSAEISPMALWTLENARFPIPCPRDAPRLQAGAWPKTWEPNSWANSGIGWNSWHSPTSPDPSFFLLMKKQHVFVLHTFVGRNTSTLKWSMNCDKCSTAEPILEIFMCQWRFHVRTKNNKSFLPADWCATIFQWAQTWLWFLRDVLKTESVKKCSFKTSKPEVTYLNTSYQCLPLQQSPPSSYQVTLPVQHSPDSSWWNPRQCSYIEPGDFSGFTPWHVSGFTPKKTHTYEYEPPDSCRSKWSEVRYLQTRSESSFPGRFFSVEV